MTDATDPQLLRKYAESRSEAAFGELVRRHVDFVYSAALRMVCDSHLAEDVTQEVFLAFARNAAQLTDRQVLSGWLHRTAQNIAAQTVRTIERRRAREHEVAAMNELLSSNPDVVWDHIAPHLDEALAELGDADRDALLLRYFERKSAREMAQMLGTTEDAAQKRVSRAVERLREFFARRGHAVGTTGLIGVMTANAVQAAPAGLAASITTATAVSATAATATASKAIIMTTLRKTLIWTALAAAVATGIYESRQASAARSAVQAINSQQAPQAGEIRRLQKELAEAATKLAAYREENGRLSRDTQELLKLRSQVSRLRGELRQALQGKPGDANDPTTVAMHAWIHRAKLLKDRAEQWPAKTPELQLLTEQDWLDEAAKRDLDGDEAACREALARLRQTAIGKFAHAVQDALEQFAKANNDLLPSDLSQLASFLQPPMDSFLQGYEIAKPGSVHPPQPNTPESVRAETWAMVVRGSFTDDGKPIRDGTGLADPEYDSYRVIYRGGTYWYGPSKPPPSGSRRRSPVQN